jgi:4-oxalocrotonate tautomerase
MPIVSIKIAQGRSREQKRRLVQEITRAVVKTLEVEPDWVSVLIEEYDRENWGTGGQLHLDKLGPGCGREGS